MKLTKIACIALVYLFMIDLYAKDPYENLFNSLDQAHKKLDANVYLYKAYVASGESLAESCSQRVNPAYPSIWDSNEAMLSVAASLQSIALHTIVSKMGQIAIDLDIDEKKYTKYTQQLVDNYCSNDFTLMSFKKLKKEFKSQFLSKKRPESVSESLINEQQFYWLGQLFKGVCSWGNNVYSFGLMAPLLKDPFIMAEVIRRIQTQKFVWNNSAKKVNLEKIKDYGNRALCRHKLCREVPFMAFKKYFSRGVAYKDLDTALKGLYCHKFRHLKLAMSENEWEKNLYQEIFSASEQTITANNFYYRSYFSSLLTSIEYLGFNSDPDKTLINVIQTAYRKNWDEWASQSLLDLKEYFYYEEPLTIDVVSRTTFFDPYKQNFALVLDVNMGELDRSFQVLGKISFSFDVSISRDLIDWAHRKL